MIGNRYVFLPAVLLATILAAVLVVPASALLAVGDKAPDFQLGSVDGKSTVKLSDYTNQPTLLVFWVSWCPHCQREAPVLNKVYKDLRSKGMNVVGVSTDEDQANAKEFVSRYSLAFPNAYAGTEKGQSVLASYQIVGVPTIYVIGKDGMVKASYVGETPEATIRKDFAALGVK
jgi:peroxiredoxin